MATQEEIRSQITSQIIEALEKGVKPWRQPWLGAINTGRPANIVSRRNYRGINPLLLLLHQQRHGFRSRFYGTFRQWQELGCTVQKRPTDVPPGAWGCSIIYYCPISKLAIDPLTGKEMEENYFVLKKYVVFSIDQVLGDHLDHFRARDDGPLNTEFIDFVPAERAIAATEAEIRFGGDRAFYRRDQDFIQMPPKEKFPHEQDYYAAAFHELGHWSEKRTEWNGDYAINELRAEITASYCLAELGVPQSEAMTENHHSYLQSWLTSLKNDNRFIFKASTGASKAADFILSFSRQPEPVLEEVPF